MTSKKAPAKKTKYELNSSQVYRNFSLASYRVKDSRNLKSYNQILDQKRAVAAIELGLKIKESDYNIFVCGERGTGKSTIVRTFLSQYAERRPTPPDIVFVNNFDEPEFPKFLKLPAGTARRFSKQMDDLAREVIEHLPAVFESKEYEDQINLIIQDSRRKEAEYLMRLEKRAKRFGFTLKSTKMGLMVIPVLRGKKLTSKDMQGLPEKDKKEIEKRRGSFEPHLADFLRKIRAFERESKEEIRKIQEVVGNYIIGLKIDELAQEYKLFAEIQGYLRSVQNYLLKQLLDHLDQTEIEIAERIQQMRAKLRECRVHVFVDNSVTKGAPVIYDNHPTYYNVFGKVERNIENGVFFTDFTYIKPGSFGKASGGYLVIDAHSVLENMGVWEALKRSVKSQKLVIEDLGENLGYLPTTGLRPEPIPTDVKIIMIGTPYLYNMLYDMDPDFRKLFKIKADFDHEMVVNDRNVRQFFGFVAHQIEKKKLLPFDRSALERLMEHGFRVSGHQNKITLQLNEIVDVMVEANHMVQEKQKRIDKKVFITADNIEKTLDARRLRFNLYEEKIDESFKDGSQLISVSGKQMGQINALTVYSLGDYSFGKPAKISAITSPGDSRIFNIERDVDLSGNIHNKGIAILSHLIGNLFEMEGPLSMTVSIAFEQSYGMIDGDSASMAELMVTLSAMSKLPLRQDLALTGSINQHGMTQPIGGVNEKIEGFYQICRIKGLTGKQGVVVPTQNVQNLMLSPEVRDAIEAGRFHVYAVADFREAVELFFGIKFGHREGKKHQYPKGSLAGIVAENILERHRRDEKARAESKEDKFDKDEEYKHKDRKKNPPNQAD